MGLLTPSFPFYSELYDTVPEDDAVIRRIPPDLFRAIHQDPDFWEYVKPLLHEYPSLASEVLELYFGSIAI